jgi:hypothetical protein
VTSSPRFKNRSHPHDTIVSRTGVSLIAGPVFDNFEEEVASGVPKLSDARSSFLAYRWRGMEVFRDLIIRGSPEQVAATMDEIERSLPPGWLRERVAEEWTQGWVPTRAIINGRVDGSMVDDAPKPVYCFAVEGDDPLAPSIYLTEQTPGTIIVSNVVPRNKRSYSLNEYNSILKKFCDRIVRPCASKAGAEVELTDDHADLDRWLSESVARKLRAFSSTEYKSLGTSHPLDQERWLDFIVAAHREGSSLDASTLRRWLIEVEGWAPEIADQLAAEYEFGGELLAFSEAPRGVA